MIDVNKSVSWGSAANVASCSILNISAWQSLATVKTFVMSGKGLPPSGSLYRGYGANLSCDVSARSVVFIANDFFSRVIMKSQDLTPAESCLGGLFSGAFSGPFSSVFERIMILTQIQEPNSIAKKNGAIEQVVKTILAKEGAQGFGRGMFITTSRESITYGCFFGLKNLFQNQFEKSIEDKKVASFMSCFSAGALAGALTTPLDLIKTRMQAEVGHNITTFQMTSRVLKEGIIGSLGNFKIAAIRELFRGCLVRSGTVGITMATFGFLLESPLISTSKNEPFFSETSLAIRRNGGFPPVIVR